MKIFLHFASFFSPGVKSEIRSPGLTDGDVTSLSQDASAFYNHTVDLGSVYDKDYPQSYSSAHQYYNTMQQAYNTSNAAAATYMNSASSFYNAPSYPYSSLSSTRSLNPACKASTAYLSSPYTTPTSPFQSTGHSQVPQYPTYGGYGAAGAAGAFAQTFSQVRIISFYSIFVFSVRNVEGNWAFRSFVLLNKRHLQN